MNAPNSESSSSLTPDWLDSTLRARPVDDDGFADRVIAVGIAADRTRLLLRALVALLLCGSLVAGVLGAYVHAVERLQGNPRLFDDIDVPADRQAAFVRDWQRLASLPFLQRRPDGVDAAPTLNAALLALRDRDCRSKHPCDSSFLRGLARFDTWSGTDEEFGSVPSTVLSEVVVRHLQEARTTPGAAYASAVDDAVAFARLLFVHRAGGGTVLAAIANEVDAARAAGVDVGAANVPVNAADALRLVELYRESPAFLRADTPPDVRRVVTTSNSLLACGAHDDPWLDVAREFVDDDVRADLSTVAAFTGCGARRFEANARVALCQNPEGMLCKIYVAALRLPGARQQIAPLTASTPSHWTHR